VYSVMFGRLPLEEKFRFKFTKMTVANETTLSGISRNEDNLTKHISYRGFPFQLRFLLEFSELSVEWFVFGKFDNFRIFRKLCKKRFRTICLSFESSNIFR